MNNDGQMLFDVPAGEMADHLLSRALHHERRAEEYAAKAEELERELASQLGEAETVTDRMAIKSTSNYANRTSERDKHREKIRRHAAMSVFFRFTFSHLPKQEAFSLNRNHLEDLELVSTRERW